MNNFEREEGQFQQSKLILPDYPDKDSSRLSKPPLLTATSQIPYSPAKPASSKLSGKIGAYWQKDPAYKILAVALGMVILAGIVFVSLASARFIQNGNFLTLNTSNPNNSLPIGGTPAGTVDLKPSFPTPGGGQGGNTSSQPPVQSTPSLRPTPDPAATDTATPGSDGALTVEIVDIPQQVNNGSRVSVRVQTSEPDVQVRLYVLYNTFPFQYTGSTKTTDGNGNATLTWRVQVQVLGGQGAAAEVMIQAIDQNGQQAQSNPVQVQIV